jgi:hypothetical protein
MFQMWQFPMSFGPLFIQPTNSLAIWLSGKSLQEIHEITFEIGMLGKYGLDTMTPRRDTRPAVAAVEGFLRVAVICIMYADFKRIEPGMDIGVDLSQFISPSGWETWMNPLFGAI